MRMPVLLRACGNNARILSFCGRSLIVVASVVCVGCHYDPYAAEYTRKKPPREAIIGSWFLDETSEEFLAGLGYDSPAAKFDFLENGTLTITGIPACWSLPAGNTAEGTLNSATGRWKLNMSQEWWGLLLELETLNGKPANAVVPLYLRGEGPVYILHACVGDPDEGEALSFLKRAAVRAR